MNWRRLDDPRDPCLGDESRLTGRGAALCCPGSEAELAQALAECAAEEVPVTIQGGRTGLVGGAVPAGGRVISTERLNGLSLEGTLLTAGCGARLSDLRQAARRAGLRLPPDPTEETAALGGLFCCAAAGPNCARWGSVADHAEGLTLLLADGRRWAMERDRYCFDNTGCPLPDGGRLTLRTPLPPAGTPRWGFAPRVGDDLVDLFAGSEGVLATVAELRLRLAPIPAQTWGLLFFFADGAQAAAFGAELAGASWPDGTVTAAECLDGAALALVDTLRTSSSRLAGVPPFPDRRGGSVYVELESDGMPQEALEDCMDRFARLGGREEDAWAASGEGELARLRLLRHAAAEAAGLRVDALRTSLPELTRQCSALWVPPRRLPEAAARCREELDAAGIPGAIFAHALAGRMQINLLPETQEQLDALPALMDGWAGMAADWGGGALPEQGVGRLRRALLARWAPPEQLALMAELKCFFDPDGLLNPGVLLPEHTKEEA